ncbi:DUF1810 domain-containing protein [Edaphobacter bradus]|uniref:DUF1810 domain-containing protein n=1 Tax=Edaphobacter bradus TaxID=2259016 RepID=UPI0021DF6E46|nr:DUF1810 domain-containing protein [Edaphobacter bradus]
MPADSFDLQRFIDAQEQVYPQVLAELRAGRKRSHWIWFIFPQIAGLGSSPTSQHFALKSIAEAGAYLEHPVLGPRLRECTQLVLEIHNRMQGRAIDKILGDPDDLKFWSSMTLFAEATTENRLFLDAIATYFAGQPDTNTLRLLRVLSSEGQR